MASVWKHPKSKYWVACFTDHTGKQRKKSTKMLDRKQAFKVAEELESIYKKKKSETQVRKILSEAYTDIHQDEIKSATIENFFKDWIQRKENEISEGTWRKYRMVTKRFLDFLNESKSNDMHFLNQRHIVSFRDETASKLSISSANGYLKVLRAALQDAWRDGLILENPASKTPTLKRKDPDAVTRRAFTLPEFKQLLNKANDEWKGMILFGLYTGQRLGDIARISWNDINLEQKTIRFITGKTTRFVELPIASSLMKLIEGLPRPQKPASPIFQNAFDIVSKSNRTALLSNQFYDLMAEAGLVIKRSHKKKSESDDKKRIVNELSFHCLRHTATSLLKNAGVSEAVAMDIIGHDSKSISQNYTHIDLEAKRKAIESIPEFN